METVRLTTAQAIIRFLNQQYISYDGEENRFVEGIFSIFRSRKCVRFKGQALQDEKHSLRVFQGKNEQAMALAAIGYAKQKNRRQIYYCTSSVG